MSQTTRLFSLDSGIDRFQEIDESAQTTLPKKIESMAPEGYLLSPLAKPITKAPSIDSRIKELLKPVISDMSVLKAKNFYNLSNDTQTALTKEIQTEKTPEAKESISYLISLLKENSNLMSMFNNYVSLVQKI